MVFYSNQLHSQLMRFTILWLCFLFLAIACDPVQTDSRYKVFRYNEDTGISSLDPAFAKDQTNIRAVGSLFNGLVQLDRDLNIAPAIAKDWEVSANGLEYTFILRNDVHFHDHEVFANGEGRLTTAEDFVYSFERIIDPAVASPGAWIFNDKVLTPVERDSLSRAQIPFEQPFQALNDTTLRIQLKKPFPAFFGLLTMPYCSVVPWEIIEHYGQDFRDHPVGTGPFRFELWEEGVRLILLRNEHYFETYQGRQLPLVDAVSISFTGNKQIEFMEFVQQKLDFFTGLEGSFKDELLTRDGQLSKKYEGQFQLMVNSYLNTEYLGMLVDTTLEVVQQHPFRYKAVRQAVNHAINREQMLTYFRNNIGTPGTSGFVPKGLPSFDPVRVKGYNYDPAKARALLKEAGFPNGKGMPEIAIYTNKNYLDLTIFMQSQLAEVGIKSRIEVNPGAFHRDLVSKSQLNFFRGSWLADYPDAENYLSLFYSPNFAPNGPNYTHFRSALFDSLYNVSLLASSDSLRFSLYQQMDQLVMDEAPVVVLYYDQSIRLVQNYVKGLENNAMNHLVLKWVELEQ